MRVQSLSAHMPGNWSSGGLKTLSRAAAEALSRRRADLVLEGLEYLSEDAATALVMGYRGRVLSLGFRELKDEMAQILARHEGGIALNKLENISGTVAEITPEYSSQMNPLWTHRGCSLRSDSSRLRMNF